MLSTSVASFAFDYNGNTTSKTNANGTTTYTWDYENRLTSVTLPGTGGTVTFKYDPFGRRIQKSGPAGTTNFLYDGANVVADVNASGAFTARYVQGSGIDEPLALSTATGTSFFQADGLGSVTSLSGAAGVTDTYTYKPFGITTTSGTTGNRFRFTGREWDQETGLYYYRARYYDPSIGRFISEDPLRFFSDINFYRYVFNSPVNFIDPLGLECTCTYHQATGAIRCVDEHGNVVAEGTGYAGNGQGVNNPSMQGVEDTGPLPQGSYDIGRPTNGKGPLTLPLRPRPGTNLRGRPGGFLIHGDNKANNQSASHGCIIQSRNVRQAIADCGGGTVNVEQ